MSMLLRATRIIRFLDENKVIRYGQVPIAKGHASQLIENNDIFGSMRLSNAKANVVKLLAPFVPSQIIGIGLNYRKHAQETNRPIPSNPVMFIKLQSALQNPNDPIQIPHIASDPHEVDYECELGVLIGKDCLNVPVEEAMSYVHGYTIANDVTARRWQGEKGGNQWSRAKSFDTFCPIGPMLVTKEEIADPQNLCIQTKVNGVIVQDSSTNDMVFSIAELISRLSQGITLMKNTLILTGTPEGVGVAQRPSVFLKAGDQVEMEIEKIGVLSNPVTSQRM